MKRVCIFNAQIVTAEAVLPEAGLEVCDGRITRVLERCSNGDIDLQGCYLLPGLIDIHTHPKEEDGTDPQRLLALCRDLRGIGTAAFLFAIPGVPAKDVHEVLRKLRRNLESLDPAEGCLGVYMESPYIPQECKGGFSPAALATPQQVPLSSLLDAAGEWIRYINVGPELPGAIDVIREARGRGILVSLGHTAANKACLMQALDAGANTVCHCFNTGFIQAYKEPGVLDVTLSLLAMATDELACELICDGVHVDPILVRALCRAKGPDGVILITDSIVGGRAASEGEEIRMGPAVYRVVNGVGRTAEGLLAGSTLSMARAVRNFAHFSGLGLVAAARAGGLVPARLLGIEADYGSIRVGKRALFCVLDNQLNVRQDLCKILLSGQYP